ncbi:MAG: IS4 family transposase [Desulfosalsimonadaceae bacterium]
MKLAWRLLCYKCANLFQILKNLLFSQDFIEKHRNSPTAFTRNRKLPFHLLVCFILSFLKGSYQKELDYFFQTITRSRLTRKMVSNAAFAKARMKLGFEAFIELNQCLVDAFASLFNCLTWEGFRILSIDGTLLTLQHFPEIITHFGTWNCRQGDPCPKARASQLYDSLNKLTLKAVLTPKDIGERQHAAMLLSDLPSNALILMDRGYPAFWLFKLILSQNAGFCARISRQWKIVRWFINSGKKEKIIELKAGVNSRACRELGLDTSPMKLRLIRVVLGTGEVEVLITSLVDKNTHPHNLFHGLYHIRWAVEEDYKTIKSRIEMEAFTGQSVLSVYQDFHARIFAKNLVSALSFPAQVAVAAAGVKKKHVHQINFAQAIAKAKHLPALLFQRTKRTMRELIREFMEALMRLTEPIRPGRKYPRKHKIRTKKYYQNYKPVLS